MKIFAGIDGGGTRTRLALVCEDGALAGYAEGGSCCFTDHSLQRAHEEFGMLWRAGWRSAGCDPRPADALFMGMGSILSQADAQTNCALAVELLMAGRESVRADNDAWSAHAGGLRGRPGMLLISGTGSACLGRNAAGATWRSGGWGYLLNDAGSGHALGQAAMIAATRDADGRGRPTALTALVQRTLGLQDMKEIFRKVHHEGVARAQVAALAPWVVAEAEAGDPVAREILQEGAGGLVEMVVTVARRLQINRPEIAITGGLILNAALFRQMFLERLASELEGFTIADQGFAPVFGAVLLAYQHATGTNPPDRFLENLRATTARLTAS